MKCVISQKSESGQPYQKLEEKDKLSVRQNSIFT
jgi:hypothetical protein